MTRTKKALIVLSVLFAAMQILQPDRNTRASPNSSAKDITMMYNIPANVKAILHNSCYDCHSNAPTYPWYSYVQPFGWWLAHHIDEGKAELNLSEFGDYSIRKQQSKLKAMGQSVSDGEMPLPSYLLLHPRAKLDPDEQKTMLDWVNKTKDELSKTNSR